jgi:hypothetical protein
MEKLTFKKIDNNCYFITNGSKGLNMFLRYSNSCKHYEVDICKYYFEEKTIKKIKDKVTKYWNENKLELFEFNRFFNPC